MEIHVWEDEICVKCGKKREPYTVIMDSNPLSLAAYFTAREEGPICEECWKEFCEGIYRSGGLEREV
jgi:hypothetical protein